MLKQIRMFVPYMSPRAAESVAAVLKTPMIGQGKKVDEFEGAIKRALDLSYVVVLNNSASAIRLALSMSGVKPGDEVITTALTCTLTNHPILEQFAKPVFADIQLDTGNVDPNDVERRITERTKAILCTHWSGVPCDVHELSIIARRHGIPVIEDASEAFGARYHGTPIGTHSPFVAFSFHAVQLVTAGEGGALSLQSARDYGLAKMMRWYGIDREGRRPNPIGYYDMDICTVGYGYYLTNVSAAIGLENIASLNAQLEHRREVADHYWNSLSKNSAIILPRRFEDRIPSYHFFTILVERREEFCRAMRSRGVEVSIVHCRNDAYTVFGGLRRDLPVLDKFSESYIGLPTHMALIAEDVEYIIACVQQGW
ncbi:MAG: DegT/DnrJ/EryC1/StrS family aminotransferase [Limisphaerales bacterium]